MQLIQTISMDLAFRGITPRIYGKQDDSGAMRGVRIELFNAGVAYAISSGTTFLLRYKTAQGAIGLYDALPDGTSAFSFVAGENTVTATFVDQMFAKPGDVECELRIVDPVGVATTWKWILDVERGNVGDASIPSDYINAFNVLAASAADAAARAEAAAGNVDTSGLMKVSDYDSSGDVRRAGGIASFVSSAALKLGNLGPATVYGFYGDATGDGGLVSQQCYRLGPLAIVSITYTTEIRSNGKNCGVALTGLPLLKAPIAATGAFEDNVVVGGAYVQKDGSSRIAIRITLNNETATFAMHTLSVAVAYLIDE